jgi:hypothetical protein
MQSPSASPGGQLPTNIRPHPREATSSCFLIPSPCPFPIPLPVQETFAQLTLSRLNLSFSPLSNSRSLALPGRGQARLARAGEGHC